MIDLNLDEIKKEQDKVKKRKAILSAVGSLGDTFANRASAADIYLNRKPQRMDVSGTTDKIAAGIQDPMEKKKKLYQAIQMKRDADKNDPGSAYNKTLMERYATAMGAKPEAFEGMTFENAQPLMKLEYEKQKELNDFNRQKKLRDLERQNSIQDWQNKEDYKNQQKIDREEERRQRETLVPGLGHAQTPDDAKKLKDAVTLKDKLDRQLGEMIDLRKKYGAEVFNREAVGRGKQLSKDILLTYKNLAKLGVLSKSDEDIINQIIPKDPLEYQASQLVGQDPIMNNLSRFKDDVNADFANNVRARMQDGFNIADRLDKESDQRPKETAIADTKEIDDEMSKIEQRLKELGQQ